MSDLDTKKLLEEAILLPEDIDVSFDNFPYFLSDTVKEFLISSTYLHLDVKCKDYATKLIKSLQTILLSGTADLEIYMEALAKALAKYFKARLLIVDCLSFGGVLLKKQFKGASQSDKTQRQIKNMHKIKGSALPEVPVTFKEGDRVKFIDPNPLRKPMFGSLGTILYFFKDETAQEIGVRMDKPFEGGCDLGGLCEVGYGLFCRDTDLEFAKHGDGKSYTALIDEIYEFASEKCKSGALVMYLRGIEKVANRTAIEQKSKSMPRNMVVIGSYAKLDETGLALISFRNKLRINPPQDEASLSNWTQELKLQFQIRNSMSNAAKIRSVFKKSGLECPNIENISLKDQALTTENAEKIIAWAVSHHFIQHPSECSIKDSKIVMSTESIEYGLDMLQRTQNQKTAEIGKTAKIDKIAEMDVLMNELDIKGQFERELFANVIMSTEIGVRFDDIGALEYVKSVLEEVVMFPLQQPELFTKGQLTKPCKGLLLYGPPGTGKTMLAKALATESGANFLNITFSSISSKWFGESERYVHSLFTLASKIAPCIIFIDEADSIFGTIRWASKHIEDIKKEFLIGWDGLRTKEEERVLVILATNRPFDLDESIIRRLPRKLMVNLPDSQNREKILKVILEQESLDPDVDLKVMAERTDGFSGSDLKNMCTIAAFRVIKEILENEKKGKSLGLTESSSNIEIRPLKMRDLLFAYKKVCSSVSKHSYTMTQLLAWDKLHGEDQVGSKRGYFLRDYM